MPKLVNVIKNRLTDSCNQSLVFYKAKMSGIIVRPCSLIMAKWYIAPLRQPTIPRMELSTAVILKHGRKVIEKETRCNCDFLYQPEEE